MKLKEERFKNHLETKYGKEISERLYNEGKIQTDLIKKKNKEDQNLVKNHLREIKLKDNKNLDINIVDEYHAEENNWAFDFSGWIGKLDFSKKNIKKYMIIGLEPHIEAFDFQVTYGLSDNTPICNTKRFKIDTDEQNFIDCKNDSNLIWTNLFKLLASETTKNEVIKNKNEEELIKFLNQFYITDLCHFAPQDKAKAIASLNKWSKIRYDIANVFLINEIEIINPEIIITQGIGVFNEIKKILNFEESTVYSIPFGKKEWQIKMANHNGIKIISLPHIGSKLVHKTFWLKNLEKVSDKIENMI